MLSNPGLLFCILSSDNFKLSRSKSRQQRKPWRRSYKTFPMKQFFPGINRPFVEEKDPKRSLQSGHKTCQSSSLQNYWEQKVNLHDW